MLNLQYGSNRSNGFGHGRSFGLPGDPQGPAVGTLYLLCRQCPLSVWRKDSGIHPGASSCNYRLLYLPGCRCGRACLQYRNRRGHRVSASGVRHSFRWDGARGEAGGAGYQNVCDRGPGHRGHAQGQQVSQYKRPLRRPREDCGEGRPGLRGTGGSGQTDRAGGGKRCEACA